MSLTLFFVIKNFNTPLKLYINFLKEKKKRKKERKNNN